ncbi:MAG: DNA repair protein RecN [Clostridiales bacterium]|nr:DNA repair protein RecN [Clostridiales bacterium]
MLELLHIENIAVIERSDIELSPGFNVMTGETGAGKSIVIDSINTILGARASRELVRTGAARASVTGSFRCETKEVLESLSSMGVTPDEDGFIVLRRDITSDGRGTCRINGSPVSVGVLREAGALLVSIHGQHENQKLLNDSQHLSLLDRASKSGQLLEEYSEKYRIYKEYERKLKSFETDEKKRAQRADMLRYQIGELNEANLVPGEEEPLEERRLILQNASRLSEAVTRANVMLYGDDTSDGAVSEVDKARRELSGCSNITSTIDRLCDELDDIYERLRQAANDVLSLTDKYEYNERELDDIEFRLDTLSKLKKKYGSSVEEMLAYLEDCKTELSDMESADFDREKLEKQLELKKSEALEAAKKLSDYRKKSALELEKLITGELKYLDMKNARFVTEFKEVPMSGSGTDEVRFLISVNAGEEVRPLSKIASGGELSRIMLALQSILASADDIETMIFDEIDTGVSGRAAQKVAEKLAGVARLKQVICVTHSTQLAAMADCHMLIEKREERGRTYTSVVPLEEEGRQRELARITSGATVTESGLKNALEMLSQAREYKKGLRQEM